MALSTSLEKRVGSAFWLVLARPPKPLGILRSIVRVELRTESIPERQLPAGLVAESKPGATDCETATDDLQTRNRIIVAHAKLNTATRRY